MKENSYDHINRCRKGIWKYLNTYLWLKTQQIRNTEELSQPNVNPSDEKRDAFLLRSGPKQGCPFLPLLFNVMLETLAKPVRQRKETKYTQIRKEEKLFADNKTYTERIYIENPKESTTTKNLGTISSCSKVAGHKFNIQKSVLSCIPTINYWYVGLKMQHYTH